MAITYRHLDEFLIRAEQADGVHDVSAINGLIDAAQQTDALLRLPVAAGSRPIWDMVANIFATEERTAWALGLERLDELAKSLTILLDLPSVGRTGDGLVGRAGALLSVVTLFTGGHPRSRDVPVQAVRTLGDVDLRPFTQIEADAGLGGITGAQCLWYDAAARRQRVALATFRICADGTVALDARTHGLLPGAGLSEMALVMGGEPLLTWCAGLPLPATIDRYLVGSWLRRKPLHFASCITHGLYIPAEADIVLEGMWDAARGVMRVDALTQRANPTLTLLLPGERRWMDAAYSRLMLPLIRFMLDAVVDVHLRDEVALVSVRSGRGRDAIYSFWGMASILPQRTVIAFDETVDVWDARAVEAALAKTVDWERDVMVAPDWPESLAETSRRVGIDASTTNGVLKSDVQ